MWRARTLDDDQTMTADTVARRSAPPPAGKRPFFRRRSAIPGFGLTMGVTLTVLSLIVLLPLSAVVLKAAHQSPAEFWAVATSQRSLAAYRLTFGAAFVAAVGNGGVGGLERESTPP